MTMLALNTRVWMTALMPTRNQIRRGLNLGGGLFVAVGFTAAVLAMFG